MDPTDIPTPVPKRVKEPKLSESVITLDQDAPHLISSNAESYTRGYGSKSEWRYVEDGELVDRRNSDDSLALLFDKCLTKTSDVRYDHGTALYIEVGQMPDSKDGERGRFVWRSMFSKDSGWDNRFTNESFEEPEVLKDTVAEAFKTFGALCVATNTDTEDTQQVLRLFGQYLESRVELAFEKLPKKPNGGKSSAIHIVPSDYTLLDKGPKPKPQERIYSYETDRFDHCAVSRSPSLTPSLFKQVLKSEPSPYNQSRAVDRKSYLDIAVDIDTSHTETAIITPSIVWPWTAPEIEAVQEWLSRTEPEGGDHSTYCERMIATAIEAVEAFRQFETRVSMGYTLKIETPLLSGITNPRGANRNRALQTFVISALQSKLEETSLKAGTHQDHKAPVIRVSALADQSDYRREQTDRMGIYSRSDLRGAPQNAVDIAHTINHSIKLSKEMELEESRRLELEELDHAAKVEERRVKLDKSRGAPPTYDELDGDIVTSEVVSDGDGGGTKRSTHASGKDQHHGEASGYGQDSSFRSNSGHQETFSASLPQRPKSGGRSWKKYLCGVSDS